MSAQSEIPADMHGAECFICKQPINSSAGNPSLWGMKLPFRGSNGQERNYHWGCAIDAIAKSESVADLTAERDQARAEAAALREKVAELEGIIAGLKDVAAGYTKPLWLIDAELQEKFGMTLAEPTTQPAPEGDDAK